MDFEFETVDRIMKIKSVNESYDLENNAVISYSGGKDSAVVSNLIDFILPKNKIPRIYCDTGLELSLNRKFVISQMEKDSRIIKVTPEAPIKQMLLEFGFPFKSKQHAYLVEQWQKGNRYPSIQKYVEGTKKICCPKKLLYQFTNPEKLDFKVSAKCCDKLKKEPMRKKCRELGRKIVITGMRRAEQGQRQNINCLTYDHKVLSKFNPIAPCSNEWVNKYCDMYHVELSPLYSEPFNFERTGCAGCPFNLHVQADLEMLRNKCPSDYKKAWAIFGVVYQEMSRLKYRWK